MITKSMWGQCYRKTHGESASWWPLSLEAAQKTDRLFSVHHSSQLTIQDALSDILKMTWHLMKPRITVEEGVFVDLTDLGWRKMTIPLIHLFSQDGLRKRTAL